MCEWVGVRFGMVIKIVPGTATTHIDWLVGVSAALLLIQVLASIDPWREQMKIKYLDPCHPSGIRLPSTLDGIASGE